MPLAIMRTVFAILCLNLITVSVTSAGDDATGGPDFMALGKNPDWHLEIINEGSRIIFTTDEGVYEHRYTTLGPSLYRDELTTVYQVPSKDHMMNVTVRGRACQDSVTGKLYDTTVTVMFDGFPYAGCGDVLNQ